MTDTKPKRRRRKAEKPATIAELLATLAVIVIAGLLALWGVPRLFSAPTDFGPILGIVGGFAALYIEFLLVSRFVKRAKQLLESY